ncbi:DUF4350 domain-containing protein [Actinoplanes sp. NPDC049548]|uniref:DUF4350 domain-containing protein n=1 Tax=Actinoplanes sp. NPDC049548 TaxID=3155152 RepID=UPI0034157C60
MKNPRRLRLIAPLAVVLGLATITGVAHVVQQPDPTDATFLSPTSDEGQGARLLADGLSRKGVAVEVRHTSQEALDAIGTFGETTLFVTTPGLVHPTYLERFAALPPRVRVVMVAPRANELNKAGLDVVVGGPRWTAAAVGPGCGADFAGAAGPAAVLRWRYDAAEYAPVTCYDGGLAEFRAGGFADITLVGAVDPFRNDRADEHGNSELAVGVLARSPRVIWLDLHEREPAPRIPPPPPAGTGSQPGGDSSGDDDGWTDDSDPDGEPGGEPTGEPQPGDEGGETVTGGAAGESALAQAFPPSVWATLALLVLAAIALALASARRLGAPVAEPLPVQVRTAETVRGLGGLYRRARARGASLATVQSAARARLADHLDLPPTTPVDELAARVAAYAGLPEDDVRHLLGGGVEDSDAELVRAATAVQDLVRFVTGQQNAQQAPDEGNVT